MNDPYTDPTIYLDESGFHMPVRIFTIIRDDHRRLRTQLSEAKSELTAALAAKGIAEDARWSAEEEIKRLKAQLTVRCFWCGKDHPPNECFETAKELAEAKEARSLAESKLEKALGALKTARGVVELARLIPRNMGCENSPMCEFTCGCEICKLHEALVEFGKTSCSEGTLGGLESSPRPTEEEA